MSATMSVRLRRRALRPAVGGASCEIGAPVDVRLRTVEGAVAQPLAECE